MFIHAQGIRGTGADGRIVSRDVAGAQAAVPMTAPTAAAAAGPYEHIELSNMRKVSTHIYTYGNSCAMWVCRCTLLADYCKASSRVKEKHPSLLSDSGHQCRRANGVSILYL